MIHSICAEVGPRPALMAGTAMLMTLMSILSSSTGPTSVASANQRAAGDCIAVMGFQYRLVG